MSAVADVIIFAFEIIKVLFVFYKFIKNRKNYSIFA